MLFWSRDPQTGMNLNLGNSGFWPENHAADADEYLGWLRARYRRDARPFVELARDARERDLTLFSVDRADLVEVLYRAICAVAATHGWSIAGGHVESAPMDSSGRYVPPGR